MQEAGGLPSREAGGRRGLVLELLAEDLMAWALVLQNAGLATVDTKAKCNVILFWTIVSLVT